MANQPDWQLPTTIIFNRYEPPAISRQPHTIAGYTDDAVVELRVNPFSDSSLRHQAHLDRLRALQGTFPQAAETLFAPSLTHKYFECSLRFAGGAHDALQGPFVHLEFADPNDPDVVYLETLRTSSIFVDEPEITGQYQETFLRLEDQAAPPDQLPALVDRALREFREG